MARYSDIIAGLQLFSSKSKPGSQVGGADHDVIYGGPLDLELTEDEAKSLEEWGWCKSSEYDCWCHYV